MNLTQEELSEQSGISVRTIQRIESGTEPRGQTLKILARTLGVDQVALLSKSEEAKPATPAIIKLINISSLPICFIPLANVALPVIIMLAKKQFTPMVRQIISLQIAWSIASIILFMLAAFSKKWFAFENNYMMVVMVVLVLSNVFIILRNAAELDKRGRLFIQLGFSII